MPIERKKASKYANYLKKNVLFCNRYYICNRVKDMTIVQVKVFRYRVPVDKRANQK